MFIAASGQKLNQRPKAHDKATDVMGFILWGASMGDESYGVCHRDSRRKE